MLTETPAIIVSIKVKSDYKQPLLYLLHVVEAIYFMGIHLHYI